jgi:hypothetical protein
MEAVVPGVSNMRIGVEPATVSDLMETIAYYGLPHHYPLALGDWTDALQELCGWSGISVQPKVAYRDYLAPTEYGSRGSPGA